MCNPVVPPETALPMEDRPAPWGHSYAAHRVHGACSHCSDYSVEEEVIAWRTHENRRYAAHQGALASSGGQTTSRIDLAAVQGRPCPACRREALTAVTVTLVEGRVRKQVGGWAYCTECDYVPAACYCQPGDTPHLAVPLPTTEEESRG